MYSVLRRYSVWDRMLWVAIMLYAMLLPFGGMLHSWMVILLFLAWLIHPDWKNKFQQILSSKWILPFIGMFLIQWIGLLYSSDTDNAWFKIEQKTTLFLVPLAMTTSIMKDAWVKKSVMLSMILSAVFSMLINNVLSLTAYLKSGEKAFFFYTSFSHFLHTAYYALLLCLALGLLMHLFFTGDKMFSIGVWSLLIVILVAGVFQSASKAGLLALLLIPIFYAREILLVLKLPKYLIVTISIVTLAFLATLAYLFKEQLRLNNFKFMTQEIKSDESNLESNRMRLLAWSTSWELIQEKPLLGYGTGDVSEVLDAAYIRKGIHSAAEHSLNAHNQYLQSALAQGVLGLLLLCSIPVYFLLIAIRQHNLVLSLVITLLAFNFLFESMLETRSGLVIFSFILPMTSYLSSTEEKTGGAE